MDKEAVEVCTTYMTFDPTNLTARECAWRLRNLKEGAARLAFDQGLVKDNPPYVANYLTWVADDYLAANDLNNFEMCS